MKLLQIILLLFPVLPFSAFAGSLTPVDGFGENPGDIKMYQYVPDNMPANAPLVIVLHGCRQSAHIYANAGWLKLADEWKFHLVFPEQQVSNHPLNCWNWFVAEDTQRGEGEARSIIEMVEYMQANYTIDNQRIFVEGLSAGGFMTANLLAAYPDVFAGGAINAGGPSYCANTEKHFWDPFGWWFVYSSSLQARTCLQGWDRSPESWADRIREFGFNDHDGPWPILSIWHGQDDGTVKAQGQQEILDQWSYVHGIDLEPDHSETIGPDNDIQHVEYHDAAGKVRVETWSIPGMGHGTPINTGLASGCGQEDDYILDAGICAVRHIGHFWGLDE